MKNKARADNKGYNMLLHTRLGSAGMPGEKGHAAVCLGRGFAVVYSYFFLLLHFQLSPAAAFLLGNPPSCSHPRGYKDILLQSKTEQETIILSHPFLDGSQDICCWSLGFFCQVRFSGEVSMLTDDQSGHVPKKLAHSYCKASAKPSHIFTQHGNHAVLQPRNARSRFAPLALLYGRSF